MQYTGRYGIFGLLMVGLAALYSAPALAQNWAQIASTCTPDENVFEKPENITETKSLVKHDFRGTTFQFLPRALSAKNNFDVDLPITVRCNVLNPLDAMNPPWTKLTVSYQDPDGAGRESRVEVRLIRVFRPTGNTPIATFDSDTTYSPVPTFLTDRSVSFNNSEIDFSQSDYFIEINLFRTTLRSNPRVIRVRLD